MGSMKGGSRQAQGSAARLCRVPLVCGLEGILWSDPPRAPGLRERPAQSLAKARLGVSSSALAVLATSRCPRRPHRLLLCSGGSERASPQPHASAQGPICSWALPLPSKDLL